jgi:hypothetical protein
LSTKLTAWLLWLRLLWLSTELAARLLWCLWF